MSHNNLLYCHITHCSGQGESSQEASSSSSEAIVSAGVEQSAHPLSGHCMQHGWVTRAQRLLHIFLEKMRGGGRRERKWVWMTVHRSHGDPPYAGGKKRSEGSRWRERWEEGIEAAKILYCKCCVRSAPCGKGKREGGGRGGHRWMDGWVKRRRRYSGEVWCAVTRALLWRHKLGGTLQRLWARREI